MEQEKLIIIGAGPAGYTAGVYASRANLKPLLIEGHEPGGQLMGTTAVENWPGNISIMGPELMMNMKKHAEHYGTRILSDTVTKVDFSKRPFTIWTQKGAELKAEVVIIATGAVPKRLQVPDEDLYWGKGVTSCAVCDGAFYPDKRVVIVGGGDTAMEDASFMTKFTDKITIVQLLDKLTASTIMQKRVLDNPKIKIIYSTSVTEIKGDGKHVNEIVLTNQETNEQTTLPTEAVFIAIGMIPSTPIFRRQLAMDDWGYLKLTDKTKTSVEGVFAAGDVADFRYRQAITSAGTGCMAALDAERWLAAQE